MFATPKRHILARNREFWHILCQNLSRGFDCRELQEPKKTNTFWCAIWCAKSRIRGNEPPGLIVTNFCTGIGVHDVITYANFYDSRIRGFGVVGWGSNFGLLHWLASSRLQHSRTTVRMCDITCWKVTVIARPSKCRCVRLRTRMNLLNLHYELSLFDIATHSMTICTGHSSSFLPGGCSGPVGRVSDS